jgi:hypothetical protein
MTKNLGHYQKVYLTFIVSSSIYQSIKLWHSFGSGEEELEVYLVPHLAFAYHSGRFWLLDIFG